MSEDGIIVQTLVIGLLICVGLWAEYNVQQLHSACIQEVVKTQYAEKAQELCK